MTYDEYIAKIRALSDYERAIMGRKLALRQLYIQEHEPLHLKKYQRVVLRLRVTQSTRNRLVEKYRRKPDYQLGHEYTVTGIFCKYELTEKGSVYPFLYECHRMIAYDELLSIKLAKNQPQGDCLMCRKCIDGYCFKNGWVGDGIDYADHKVMPGDVVCPHFEEMLPGGLYLRSDPSKHYPNVTIVGVNDGRTSYRIYAINWKSYIQLSEKETKRIYTTTK